jgi:hypothetical protein
LTVHLLIGITGRLGPASRGVCGTQLGRFGDGNLLLITRGFRLTVTVTVAIAVTVAVAIGLRDGDEDFVEWGEVATWPSRKLAEVQR